MMKTRAYVICSTPRSGSTLLCYLMKSTGQAGVPESYFSSVPYYTRELNVSVEDPTGEPEITCAYIQAIRKEGTGETGCFGLRLQGHTLKDLTEGLERVYPDLPDDVSRFEQAFGKTRFIHLSRNDKVAQAVSRLKAEQSGLWHKGSDGDELERLSSPSPLQYDRQRITEFVAELEEFEAAWTSWFKKQGISPIRATYESLSASPKVALAEILLALGLDPNIAADIEPKTAKLADGVSNAWVARYKTEIGESVSGS